MSDTVGAAQAPKPRSAAAIVALVLGVVALTSSWVPIINNFSFIFALVGAVFAIVALIGTLRGKKSGKALAIASAIVNVLAIAIVLATQSAYSSAIDKATAGNVTTSDGTAASSGASSSTDTAAGGDASAEKYTIEGEGLSGDEYLCRIGGVYTNKSGAKLNYVQVSYTLFDADSNQIGTAFANTSSLEDGATWKFEATGSKGADEVASFKLAEVSAW